MLWTALHFQWCYLSHFGSSGTKRLPWTLWKGLPAHKNSLPQSSHQHIPPSQPGTWAPSARGPITLVPASAMSLSTPTNYQALPCFRTIFKTWPGSAVVHYSGNLWMPQPSSSTRGETAEQQCPGKCGPDPWKDLAVLQKMKCRIKLCWKQLSGRWVKNFCQNYRSFFS